jgi:exopolyphosphatase/guanosine-5'-triphosphate,3'-diphosphate pyrophosphatase
VRLVVYEAMTRSLTPLFNEKTLCGLGRDVQSTGLLPDDAVVKALGALRRFRALCRVMKVKRVLALATAACRDARNGASFIARAEKICGVPIEILSGRREATLSAGGVISGVDRADGLVGDLGGGSLELVAVHGHRIGKGVTLPLGGLALQDLSHRLLKRAEKIVASSLGAVDLLRPSKDKSKSKGGTGRAGKSKGRTFYAVGGTWRALARLHMTQTGYPLRVMHGYAIPAKEALAFARRVRRYAPRNRLADIDAIADARRPLLAYAALVLEYIIRVAKPARIVISTYGVREGLLFAELAPEVRNQDGLMAAARDLGRLRSRSPAHGEELLVWSDQFVRAAGLDETADERRLRHAACLLADIGWRAHPDYRGEQSLNLIANGGFGSITHEGRIFLALTVYYRYAGLVDEGVAPSLIEAIPLRSLERARALGTLLRVAHLISAAQPGVLPKVAIRARGKKLVLMFRRGSAELAGDRVVNRFRQLARLIHRAPVIERE